MLLGLFCNIVGLLLGFPAVLGIVAILPTIAVFDLLFLLSVMFLSPLFLTSYAWMPCPKLGNIGSRRISFANSCIPQSLFLKKKAFEITEEDGPRRHITT